MNEATARIKINKLLEAAGWRFFSEDGGPANIRLEPGVTIKSTDLDPLGDYDEGRPHRAIGRITPAEAYGAKPKAHLVGRGASGHFRLRYDLVDRGGRITLHRAGRMHHLGIGAANARRRVLAIVDEREVTVVAFETGEVLSSHHIEPERSYWRNQRREWRPQGAVRAREQRSEDDPLAWYAESA